MVTEVTFLAIDFKSGPFMQDFVLHRGRAQVSCAMALRRQLGL